MTRNRKHKAEIRAHQAVTGTGYLVARRKLAQPSLAEVMKEHPFLNYFGIGVFDPHSKTPEQCRQELADRRQDLADHEAAVLEIGAWLRDNITPVKKPITGSYRMKHVVERATGRYTSNGELIAAALIAGYTHQYAAPNVQFGMSTRDVKRIDSSTRTAASG